MSSYDAYPVTAKLVPPVQFIAMWKEVRCERMLFIVEAVSCTGHEKGHVLSTKAAKIREFSSNYLTVALISGL